MPSVTSPDKQKDGNSSFSCLACCFTRNHEEGPSQGRSRRNDSFNLFPGNGWIWWSRPNKQRSKRTRGRRQSTDDLAKRAERAVSLVQMGEVSRARQALEGAQMAPGTLATLRDLTDPRKRPPVPSFVQDDPRIPATRAVRVGR